MPNVVVNKFKFESMKGEVDLSADNEIKVALIKNIFAQSSTDQLADVESWSGLSADWESSGSNYNPGGKYLTGAQIIQDDVGNRSQMSADNVTWELATISAYGVIVYRESDSLPICFMDFGRVKTTVIGDFLVEWSGGIVLNLT
jgi:hypothetical protein